MSEIRIYARCELVSPAEIVGNVSPFGWRLPVTLPDGAVGVLVVFASREDAERDGHPSIAISFTTPTPPQEPKE